LGAGFDENFYNIISHVSFDIEDAFIVLSCPFAIVRAPLSVNKSNSSGLNQSRRDCAELDIFNFVACIVVMCTR
jgi:hypothetical protein